MCFLCIKRESAPEFPVEPPRALPAPPHAPQSFMLDRLPPPPDQLDISACAVNACISAMNYCMSQAGFPEFKGSRMFLYYNTRRYIMNAKDMNKDGGCTLKDVCKAISMFGACDEALWPYEKRLLATPPPDHLYRTAKQYPSCTYIAIPQTLQAMIDCLLQRGPIMMGMSVYSNIRDIHSDGVLRTPGPRDVPLGAHAVLVCGYNLHTERFVLQNCWGGSWANRGFFEVPVSFVLNNKFCWDMWTLDIAR